MQKRTRKPAEKAGEFTHRGAVFLSDADAEAVAAEARAMGVAPGVIHRIAIRYWLASLPTPRSTST